MKQARTGNRRGRRRTEYVFQDLIDVGITAEKVTSWVQYSLRGISNNQRIEALSTYALPWLQNRDIIEKTAAYLKNDPHSERRYPNTGQISTQKRWIEEAYWHWVEKHPIGKESGNELARWIDQIILELPEHQWDDSTSYIESFHRVCLKYMSKTLAYTDKTYMSAGPWPSLTGRSRTKATRRRGGRRGWWRSLWQL